MIARTTKLQRLLPCHLLMSDATLSLPTLSDDRSEPFCAHGYQCPHRLISGNNHLFQESLLRLCLTEGNLQITNERPSLNSLKFKLNTLLKRSEDGG